MIKSQSQSYVTTDGQSASLSWNEAPIWGLRPDLYYCLTVAGLLIWGALSDERTGLSLQLLLAFASAVIFGSESRRTRGHILLSQIRDFPFRRLLQLAGSRWRYSIPPPHGVVWSWSIKIEAFISKGKKKVKLSLCLINWELLHEEVWWCGDIAPQFFAALDGGEWSDSRLGRFTPG
jgi:hypothetical protein